MIPLSKGRITQPAYDRLKAGQPATAWISLYSALGRGEAVYKSLKAQVLSGYGPGEIEVVQDHPRLPDLTIAIHSLHTLQALLDDPKVKGVFAGPIPVCPA